MDYQKAKNIRGTSFADLMSDKLIGGRGVGSALTKTISEKSKARMAGIKEKFDPLNLAKKLTFGSRLGPALLGKVTGRSQRDIKYFAGDPKKQKLSSVQTAGMDPEELDNATGHLGRIYELLRKDMDNKKAEKQAKDKFLKSVDDEEEKRNQELIKALTARRKKKEPVKKEKQKIDKKKQDTEQKKTETETKVDKKKTDQTTKKKDVEKTAEKQKTEVKQKTEAKPKVEKVTPKPKEVPPKAEKITPKVEKAIPKISGGDKGIMDMIKQHEGVRTRPYKDSLGLWTVGVGHLIGDGKSLPKEWDRELSMKEVDELFAKDYAHHKEMATKTPGWDKANETGQAAMIDLAFNMGGSWYKKWPNTAKALEDGNFDKAADGLKDSKWYEQVKGRAVKIVDMIRNGGKNNSTGMVPTNQSLPTSLSPTTGKQIDQASKQNKDLKENMNGDKPSQVINNTTINKSSSSKTPTPTAGDDRSSYDKKLKG